jgi:hypothetical protein
VWTILVSSGEVYEVKVRPRHPRLRPAEMERLKALEPEQARDLVAAFGPRGGAA